MYGIIICNLMSSRDNVWFATYTCNVFFFRECPQIFGKVFRGTWRKVQRSVMSVGKSLFAKTSVPHPCGIIWKVSIELMAPPKSKKQCYHSQHSLYAPRVCHLFHPHRQPWPRLNRLLHCGAKKGLSFCLIDDPDFRQIIGICLPPGFNREALSSLRRSKTCFELCFNHRQ